MSYGFEQSDVHDFVHDTRQSEVFLPYIYDDTGCIVADFKEDTFRCLVVMFEGINRNDFIESIASQIQAVQAKENIASILYDQHETTYLANCNAVAATQCETFMSSANFGFTNWEAFTARAIDTTTKLELERVVMDSLRSWRIYLSDWVGALADLKELWEDLWDYYEITLYHCPSDEEDSKNGAMMLNDLRTLEAKIGFFHKGAESKAKSVFGLRTPASSQND